jgi:hypothetical protein
MRDGKPHLQTYWEESDPKKGGFNPVLSKLGVSLSSQDKDPVREAWNASKIVNQAAVKRRDENVEAAIAAGFTPEASKYLEAYVIPRGQSMADYIYENGLDQMPRPREGWTNAGGSDDQRKNWMRAADTDGVSLEQAVEWIDAGFPFPWSGIPALIKAGVPAERAMEWETDSKNSRFNASRQVGGQLYLYQKELLSDLTIEEAREWRTFMSEAGTPLDSREIEFRDLGFAPAEAARWKNIMYYGTSPKTALKLKELGWSPSSVKSVLGEVRVRGKVANLSEEFANELIRVTPLVGGPKIVKGWIKVVERSWDDGFDNPQAVRSVVESEAWKAHAKKVTGVPIEAKDHWKLASMLPKHREAYLEVMNTEGRDGEDREYRVSRAMDLARTIASAENYHFLKSKGFPLGSTEDGIVQANGHSGAGKGYDIFDAESASKEDQDRWLRSMATTMYWKNYSETQVSSKDRESVIANPDIDPVKLKDTLIAYRGAIKAVQLEGIVVGGVESAVAGGWL